MPLRIRVDDFPHTKGEPQHTLEAFRRFDRLLRDLTGGRKYLLGVIPQRCTREHLDFLRHETDCEVGLHGVTHDEKKFDCYQNEFPPFMSRGAIKDQLLANCAYVEGAIDRRVKAYMPPRNRVDSRTLWAAWDAGFAHFTGGPETDPAVRAAYGSAAVKARENGDPSAWPPLDYHHSEPPYEYGRTDEIIKLPSDPAHYLHFHGVHRNMVLTLHWTWEVNIGLEHMEALLRKIPKDAYGDFYLD